MATVKNEGAMWSSFLQENTSFVGKGGSDYDQKTWGWDIRDWNTSKRIYWKYKVKQQWNI